MIVAVALIASIVTARHHRQDCPIAKRAKMDFCSMPHMSKLFDDELDEAMQQLFDETIEAIQLAKVSPDLDDLSATFAVALLKLGLATGFVEQRHPGFAKEVEEKRQRVIAALTQKH
jgi:hypothetical protein